MAIILCTPQTSVWTLADIYFYGIFRPVSYGVGRGAGVDRGRGTGVDLVPVLELSLALRWQSA